MNIGLRSCRAKSICRLVGVSAWLAVVGLLMLPDGRSSPLAASGTMEHVEVSAPILPRVLVLYTAEGAKFPTTAKEQAALAHDSSLTFDFLLKECPAKYPAIVVPGPGDPPTTSEQNASNFEAIATCAYQQYTSKPYWIPALVDKVDICAAELGTEWHLPGEDEVNGFGESDIAEIAKALATPNSNNLFGNFYFGLSVWVRGNDGSLRIGNLSPGVSVRVTASPVPATSTVHYEGGVALRCIRRTVVDVGGSAAGGRTGVGGVGGKDAGSGAAGTDAGAGGNISEGVDGVSG